MRFGKFLLISNQMLILIFSLSSASIMANPPLWTQQGARLRIISNSSTCHNINWVLLPGGPGLGSEYLQSLASTLTVQGTVWLLDLPGDGSNRLDGKSINYNDWGQNLVEAISSLDNVVLVAHSFAGMLVLSTPTLEEHLRGLILLNTAPDNSWIGLSQKSGKQFNLPDAASLANYYQQHHDDVGLKHVTLAMSGYFFLQKDKNQGEKLLENLPYNHLAYDWALKHFNLTYTASWIPSKIPVLIIGGERDILTPIDIFKRDTRFNRSNIHIVTIPNASHFSWVGNQNEVLMEINKFENNFGHCP